jgi:hypothetical protein
MSCGYHAVILARRVDSRLADRILRLFLEKGMKVLVEICDLDPGELSPQLLEVLDTTKIVLVVVGKGGEESGAWPEFCTVFPEAIGMRSPLLIPVLELGVTIEQMPLFIRDRPHITFDERDPSHGLRRVVSEIIDSTARAAPPRPADFVRPLRLQQESGSNEMPTDLKHHLFELEEWASANKADATKDTMAFWALKLPAIIASASAGLLAHFDLTTVSVLAGAIASGYVIIDGIHPRGMLRNTHIRAYHDIRILITRMASEWRSRSVNSQPENIARRIIRNAEPERQRIAAYIRDAETALNIKDNA